MAISHFQMVLPVSQFVPGNSPQPFSLGVPLMPPPNDPNGLGVPFMMGRGGRVFRKKSHENCKHFSPFVRNLEHLSLLVGWCDKVPKSKVSD